MGQQATHLVQMVERYGVIDRSDKKKKKTEEELYAMQDHVAFSSFVCLFTFSQPSV